MAKRLKFKVGDTVKIVKATHCPEEYKNEIGKVSKIVRIDTERNNDDYPYELADIKDWWQDAELKRAKSKDLKPLKFILKYEVDEDPVEEFCSLVEVKKRIEELFDEHGDDLSDIVVYEIKKRIAVSVKKSVSIKGI